MVNFASLRQEPRLIASSGNAVGQVLKPYFLCLSHTGESIVVCDCYNNRIQEFHLDERPPRVVVKYTDGTRPMGIALCDNGDYIITDDLKHRMLRIDQSGATKWAVGSKGSGRDQFKLPQGVCVLLDGRVVVADRGNNRLQVLNADTGAVLGTLARSGEEAWKFPCGITTDAQGLIYVVEFGNHRVVVMTVEGQVMRTLGSKGSGPGQLAYPTGVAVDGGGNVSVGDQFNHRIVIFHPDGTSTHFATPGLAYSVLIANSNRLVVSGDSFLVEYYKKLCVCSVYVLCVCVCVCVCVLMM